MANTALNRSEVLLLTNKSGGSVAQGDVVIIDSTTAASFTTTTTGAYAAGKIGVVIEPNGIANNAIGLVAFSGYVSKVALSGAASLGDLFKTHTIAKQAVRHAAPAVAGDFGEVLGTGTTPAAVLWGMPMGAAGAGTIGGSTGAADNAVIRADGVGGATIQNSLATIDDAGTVNIPTGQTYNINGSPHSHGAASANHAYYTYLASMLEPLAIEALQSGAFSYAINSSTTKLLVASFSTRLGSNGRLEMRNPAQRALPLRDVTLTGLESGSCAVIINPALATYTDARTTYFDRLNALATSSIKYVSAINPNSQYTFLPGPYGSIIVAVTNFDFTWLAARPYGTTIGWNLLNEIGDTAASDYVRLGDAVFIPVSKNVLCAISSGGERSAGVGRGGIAYVLCPSTWGKVTDGNSYDFRDDFMGASLDTATIWTRAQSSAGNIEIDTNFAWLKTVGNGNWGDNGAYSQGSISRANGKVFLCDVHVDVGVTVGSDSNLVVGFHDGGGQSYTNFAHGLHFAGGAPEQLQIWENGNNRGNVGSGFTAECTYRVRITLGTNAATYEIQGGPEYAALGGASWTDITPVTSSSTTTPLHAGLTKLSATGIMYVGDVRIY